VLDLLAVELRKLSRTFRLPFLGVCAVLLWMLAGYAAGLRHRTDLEAFEQSVSLELERIERVRAADWRSQFIVQFYLLPSRTSLLLDAGAQYLPDVIAYKLGEIDRIRYSSSLRYNYALPRFMRLDWSFVLLYVVSFGALTLTFDAVSGERERGTLRLLLSYPVRRPLVLLGKFLAVMTALWVIVLVGTSASLLIFSETAGVALEWSDLLAVLIWWLGAVLYLGVFVALGLLFSTVCRNSPQSLYWALAAWVVLALGVPAASQLAGEACRPALRGSEVDRLVEIEAAKQLREDSKSTSEEPSRSPSDMRRRIAEMYNQQFRSALGQVQLAERFSMISPNGLFLSSLVRSLRGGVDRLSDFVAETSVAVRTFAEVVAEQGITVPHPLLELRAKWMKTRVSEVSPWEWFLLAGVAAALLVASALVLVRSDIE